MQKNKILFGISGLSFFVIIFCFFGIKKNIDYRENLEKERISLDKKIKVSTKEFKTYKKETQQKAYTEALSSDNQTIRSVAVHNSNYSTMDNVSKVFFGKYYTWTDGESYRKRASNLGELITDDLKNNKKIFDEGKDTFGGDYINISGLKSEFRSVSTNIVNDIEDENKLIGLVKVEFENWYFDKKSEAAIAFKYYLVSYDKKGQNITDIKSYAVLDSGTLKGG